MRPDPAYVANVSSAMQGALREAQDLVGEGEVGERLRQVVRHARELHDILVEEVATASHGVDEEVGGVLVDVGKRLRTLERYLNAH